MLFIGNATVLIEYGEFRILTDPNFIHRHEEVPIGYGLHATRLTDPAIEIADLPPIDFVLLSHFHRDHFDHIAEEQLDDALPIITTPDTAEELRKRGFVQTQALDTWEEITVTKGTSSVTVTATPARHGPPGADMVLPEVMGSILEFGAPNDPALRLYITGDTLVIDDLAELPQRYPRIDFALMHLGGTRVMGVTVTMDAEEGVKLMQTVEPNLAIPIHYDDYDVFKSPLEDFKTAVRDAGLEGRVRYLDRGERLDLPAPAPVRAQGN
jgi:L-ascorbate metabolism protein UlaG (beta-lactamase superfamily)